MNDRVLLRRELQEFALFLLKPRYTLHEPATVQMGHAGHSQWKTSAVHQSVPQIHQRHPSPLAIDWEWHWKYRAKQLAFESGLHGPSSSWPQQFWGYKTTEETCVIMKISRFFWPSQYLRILMESSKVQLCLIPIIRLLRIQVKQRACIEAHENTIAMTSRSLKIRQKICGIVLHVLRFSNCSMSTLCALNLCFSFSACQETAGSTRRFWQHGSINRHAIQTSSSARLVACALHDHYRNAHSYSQLSNPNDTANVCSD